MTGNLVNRNDIKTISGNWTAVPRIMIDLEREPLEVMTNTPNGTTERLELDFFDSKPELVWGLTIWLTKDEQPYFDIYNCRGYPGPDIYLRNLPAATEKIWRITKTSDKMTIHCNDVTVAEVYRSECDDQNPYLEEYWRRDIDWAWFANGDWASDYYRPFRPGNSYIILFQECLNWPFEDQNDQMQEKRRFCYRCNLIMI